MRAILLLIVLTLTTPALPHSQAHAFCYKNAQCSR